MYTNRSARSRQGAGARAVVELVVVLSLLLAACTTPTDQVTHEPGETPVDASPEATEPTTAPSAEPDSPLYLDPSAPVDDRVADLLARMTLDEKIGQMTQAEKDALSSRYDVGTYFLGSLLSGGNSFPTPNTPEAWADMVDGYQEQALSTRLGIPLIYGVDAVHGNSKTWGGVVFPHNIGLGATRNPELVEQIGRITALEVAAMGVDWTFSPCLAVPQDERWGRTYEGFGETPELVSMMAGPIVRGYQGDDLSDGETILATAKHWGGDGGTTNGTDQGNTQLDEEELARIHLAPYREAIEADVGSVMISFNRWNGDKVHGSYYLITTVLKEEFGFVGFVVSDWAGIDQLPGDYYSDVVTSINAGIDMVMVPYDYREFITALRDAVESGDVPMERIDDAVSRILRAKFELGLFEEPYADRSLLDAVGSEEHREVARDAVRQSLVLLKNEGAVLPLSKELDHIAVVGRHADNIGFQCGGWTMTWQGGTGDITEGTTILEGIQQAVSENTLVTYSRDGRDIEGADVVIVVEGEEPYAEGEGDSSDLSLSRASLNTIDYALEAGVPVVVVLISGRPMVIEEERLEDWDALIAAWLPGTEGQGVADVLFGDYSPTGQLPYTWPRSVDQLPINDGDADYDPLFEYGFGLSY